MTGFATVDAAVNSLREGAYDFIQKPLRHARLAALIRRALEYRHLKIENARYQFHLEEMVRKRSGQLAASLDELRKAYQFTLEALVAMLDARERQTGQHSFRTRDLAVFLAQRMGVDGDEIDAIASGAFLHDIGKIGIPDCVLLKDSSFSPPEWEVMKQHSEIGYRILRSSPHLKRAAQIVLSHHERYDGTGYPNGLRGDQICFGARVFAVIDAYDSMRSARVYRAAMAEEKAKAEIVRHSGTQFDPNVVRVFLENLPEVEKILATNR
jgi:putative nucleotidyltransferase with HDIG domain